jgi:hypothetical protein
MNNDVTRQSIDLYEKYAAEAASVGGPRLKFVKGTYKIGDEVVDVGTKFIALMADVAQNWVRFENGKLTHSLLYKLVDGFEPCKREELGDPESTWKWDRGKPRDPWALQWLLPLQSVDTETAAIFTTDSVGGAQAVKALIREYNPQRNTGSLPIVALRTRSYTNDYGLQHAPIFGIVGWTPPDASVTGSPPIAPAAAIDVNAAAVKALTDKAAAEAAAEAEAPKNDDMNDDIPF